MDFYVEIELILDEDGQPLSTGEVDAVLDTVMPTVADLPDDVDVAADGERSSITFCVTTAAASPRAAVDAADEIASAAMRAVGVTAHFTEVGVSARRAELVGA